MDARVLAVARSATHSFTKGLEPTIQIVAGLGVEGDAHAGVRVKHRYMVRKNPDAANLCQVHLLQAELFTELAARGIALAPGEIGENVTTSGIDLLGLPVGARLHLGATAVVEVTGLRQPCSQMNGLRPGLMKACLGQKADGSVRRKAGVMGIAVVSGAVRAGDLVGVEYPAGQWRELGPV